MKQEYQNYIAGVDADEYQQLFGWQKDVAPQFDPIEGDMFGIDWTNADFIYANSTCFQEQMMDRIYQQSLKCKRGTWFMTMSKPLPRSDRILPGDQHKTTNYFTDLAN